MPDITNFSIIKKAISPYTPPTDSSTPTVTFYQNQVIYLYKGGKNAAGVDFNENLALADLNISDTDANNNIVTNFDNYTKESTFNSDKWNNNQKGVPGTYTFDYTVNTRQEKRKTCPPPSEFM